MKKSIISLLIIILALNFISAVDIDVKSSYNPGDTMQIEIPNVFLSNLQLDNTGIYIDSMVHKTPLESKLIKLADKYFYYAILPQVSGKYSFRIEDIKYWEGSLELNETIIKNFTIIATNSSYLSFSPGYISATDDFSIVIKAYNKPQQITVSFEPSNFKQNFSLSYGSTKTVYIPITGITKVTNSEVKINSYSIPTFIYPSITHNITTNIVITDLGDVLEASPSEITATIMPNTNYYYEIQLRNFLNESLENLILSSSDKEINVTPSNIEELDKRTKINITLNSKREIDAWVNISYKNLSMFIPILIKIAKNQSEVISNVPTVNEEKTCVQIGGVKCNSSSGEKCLGSEVYALDGWCCMNQCKIPSSGGVGWIIGILILLALGFGVWFIYDKSKNSGAGAEKIKNLLMKRTSSYEDRMKPQPSQEVHKGLSKS